MEGAKEDSPTTLVDILRRRARESGSETVFTFVGSEDDEDAPSLTFAELDARARAIAGELQGQGVVPGDRALLFFQPGLEFIEAFFGCLYAGAIAVPCPPPPPRADRTMARIEGIVESAQPSHVLTHSKLMDRATAAGSLRWLPVDTLGGEAAERWRPPAIDAKSLAFLQYTSGSTSRPRGVRVSHENLVENLAYFARGMSVTAEAVQVTWLPPFHDMGLIAGLLLPIFIGYPCYVMAPSAFLQRPFRWLEAISRYRGTHSYAPNFAYDLCVDRITPADRARLDLHCWKVALVAAEPVRWQSLQRFAETFEEVGFRRSTFAPGYGLAEATLGVSGGPTSVDPQRFVADAEALEQGRLREVPEASENARPLVACGEIGPRMEVRIVDPEKAAPAAEGAIGEIWVQSPSVPDGYWREPKETEATFGAKLAGHDGVFMRTGDLGFLSGGQLYVTGRIKDLVILQGRNLYPHDVEWTVESAHPALRRAGATAFAVDDGHEERLAVVAELNKVRRGDAADNAEVVAAIRQAVAEQHDASVDRVVLIPAGKLPKTTSGKVQRRATRALLLAGELETVFVWDRAEAQRSRVEAGASPDVARSAEAILVFIVQRIAERLNVAPSDLDPHQPISRFGLGSKDAVVLIGELGEWLGRSLPATLPWEHPTAAALAAHLAGEPEGKAEASAAKARASSSARDERIAVVGMACRFPGASSPEELWSLLAEGGDAVGEVPPTRWKAEAQWGGFIDGIDRFDASHFGISRREAARMDPQQRVLLEVAWEALERSGHAPTSLAGSRTGVFVGISGADHWLHAASRFSSLEAYSGTGNALSIAANRISYFLDLKGPSLAVDTACSSSLVAVHLACRSLRDGETDLAVAAGVNALLAPHLFHVFTQAHMLAADGRCKTFDARADGYVRAEGCGVVVLKRLSDAVAAGDPVLAVIDGAAINQDGRSNGMTAPNGLAQQAVVREALADAKVAPRDVGYVEAHGTGTPLGDPVEVRALSAVIESGGPREAPCFVGAVKANIGHLESAAGIAGIIKAILCLQKGQVPPQPHLRALNPEIPKGPALAFPTALVAWPRGASRRVAGVSSFGFGGTNAHVVLSEAPEPAPRPARAARSRHLFVLSARTEAALRGLAARHAKYAAVHAPRPEDVAATLSLGRTHLPYRVALVADSVDAWVAQLAEVASGATPVASARASRAKKRLAFAFTGQGAQLVGMGSGLYRTEPVFREAMDRCARILEAELPEPLLSVMFESPGGLLDRTLYTQPALFALEWALAELWRSWGIEPDVVLGHSVGEYVAACVAGVFTLEEALRLLARRARAMQALPAGGAMLSVTADEARVAAAIAGEGRLAIAAVNGPKSVVVSGDAEALGRVKAALEAEGVRTRALPVSHAFHSPLLEPALDALEAEAARIPARKPTIPLVSNLTGARMTDAPDARYWRRHARETVRFEACLRTLEAHGVDALIELGPQPTLLAFARRVLGDGPLLVPSLERGEDDGQVSLGSLGALYAQGVAIDWATLQRDGGGRRVPLPSHPFEQETFPLELVEPMEGAPQHAPPALEAEGGASQPVGAAPATERPPKEAVVSELTAMLARLMHADPSQVDPTASLLELGADSIIILEALGQIQLRFGVKLSVRQIFQELTTLAKVGDYVHRVMPPVAASPAAGQASSPSRGGGEIDRLAQQLESMARQLESLRSPGGRSAASPAGSAPREHKPAPRAEDQPQVWTAYRPLQPHGGGTLSERQRAHIAALIARADRRTGASKRWAQENRVRVADGRNVSGFRMLTKELRYPIVARSGKGPRFWDLDDNEYVDITLGFGILLFGHNPDFVRTAMSDALENGFALGAQSDMAAEVAELIRRTTRHERVFFSNTGTEAVMSALRMARAVTQRSKVVFFRGSYHGMFDGVLAGRASADGLQSLPLAPGTPDAMAADVYVLDYGEESALDFIAAHGDAIAAVLVEPVQSRRPELQPRAFLHELRRLTEQHGSALIFDEVITGFRVHPGGAQEWFGVKADLAVYGKLLGGGMPIGVIAGAPRFLNSVDGGAWRFGDDSVPEDKTTLFGGTFNKHPLAMAASRAVLRELERQGPALQERLNATTTDFVAALRERLVAAGAAIDVANFGSMFRFRAVDGAVWPLEILYNHLVQKGVYLWEGRVAFLSTTHGEEERRFVLRALEESLTEMREGGFLPGPHERTPANAPAAAGSYQKTFPLTEDQQDFWLLAQVGPEGLAAGNEGVLVRVEGELDEGALRAALDRLSSRHEALRTTVDPDGNEQRVHRTLTPSLTVTDLSALAPEARRERLRALEDEDGRRPFDLAKGPLWRASLVKLAPREHVLGLYVHHVVVDGWSVALLLEELQAILAGTHRSEPPAMPFSAYAAWRDATRDSPERREALTTYRERLGAVKPTLDIPLDRPRPRLPTFAGGRERLVLPRATLDAYKRAATRGGVTFFMWLMAGFGALLHRLTGQRELLLGYPRAVRSGPESQGVIGHATTLLPVLSRIDATTSFAAYKGVIGGELAESHGQDPVPFGALVRALGVVNHDGRPYVRALFNLEGGRRAPAPAGGLSFEPLPPRIPFTRFELVLNAVESESSLELELIYDADILDASTVRRWLEHVEVLLGAAAARPETPLADLPLLRPADREEVLRRWNETSAGYDRARSVAQQLEEQARRRPEAPAVASGGAALTYAELNRRANQVAHRLRRLGAGADTIVGVCAERSVDMAVALFGVLKAGAAYLPLDPTFPRDRVAYMLEDSGAALLLTQTALRGEFSDWKGMALELDAPGTFDREDASEPAVRVDPEALAYVIYTSGSTGRPKGVTVPRGALANFLASMAREPGLGEEDVVVAVTSISFDIAALELLLPLTVGASVHIASRETAADGAALASLLGAVKATVMQATPTTWRILIESGWAGGVRALCGGEALPPPLADALRRRAPSVWNMYGPTETTIWSSCANLGGGDAEGGEGVTLGFPIANTQLYVLDDRLAPAPLGVRGELYIGGEGVTRGYWRRPELTAERFVPDPFSEVPGARMYRTGDLVRRLADGRIEYLNRLDHQVKVRGYRIELGEIESALQKHPQVREAVVVVGDDRGGDARLVAYVVAREPSPPPGKAELQDHLKKTLPEYMVPPVFVALERLPLTPNGKIDRGRLPAVEVAPVPREHAPPRTATERTLVDAWRAVLHADPVGRDDDFFELGGHSLKATQLVSRVRAAFDVDLPLRVLFEAPTPALLAQEIDRRREHRLVPLPPVTRAPSGEPPSLTYSQERIWFIHQMDPESSAYNVTGALIVDGAVDAPCMERALREVARRHDVLLSTYAVESGRPTPKVHDASAWSLPVVDLSHHEGAEAEAKRLGMELARAPFDLARDLPYRAALYRVGPSRWVLAVSIHHIAADGWSLSIILRETFAVYGALRRGEPSPLPEPELQYRDYAHWQRKVLAPEMLAPQEKFWREALAGAPDFVSFPTDKPRPPEQSTEGGFEPFELGEPLLAEVRRFARERNVTPFMVLLSAFDVLLLRHTQQADLPVGIPIANRRWLASEGFVGTLVNMLVLRADLSGDPTFDELVARVRETALSAYANQDLPFEQLVRVLQPKRSSGYTPLFQVMFDMQDLDVPALGAEGLAVQPITSHRGGCQFDLTFTNVHVAGAPIAGVEYATALYDAATIRSLIAQFLTIVREGIAAPSRRISAIPLFGAEERHTILRGWNDTAAAYDETAYVHRVFERHAAENPNAVAVRFEGQTIPYAELDRAADRLAWRLVEQGAAGGLVGVCLERTPAMLASLLATWKAGASYVPIDPAYPEARVRMILEDGRPRVLVTQRAFEAQFARAEGLSVICADDAFAPDGRVTSNGSGARRGPPPPAAVTPESPAYTLFTSGSTGRPKGVQVPHRALVNFLASMRKAPGLTASDRLMAITTISFDIAGLELFLPLVVGASIDLLPHDVATDPALLKAAFERARPTVMQATPSMWRMLIEAGFRGSKTLKALCGGEALPPDLAQALLERTGSLWNMYGPTETTIWSTCKRMSADDPSVSIGRPIDNTQIYVLDEHREPVAVGVAGELYIGGDGVALGYLGRPDLTEERFVRDPFASRIGAKMYRTGDSARLRPDGTIEFLGRLDGQVKLRGHRIELGEIEVVLRAHPRVAEAAVAVHARSAGDQRLVGYVVTSGGAIDASELRAHLRAALPDYMVPGIYVTLEKLPLTPNGKLDRKALPALAEGSPSEAVEAPRGEAPRSGMEQAMARIWEETLGVNGVTRSDDFFALGGHSMLAVQLFAKIKERMGADLPMRSLYDAPTLEGLAALVERGGGAVTSAGPGISGSVVPIQPRGTKPPVFWIDTLGVGGGGGLLRYRLLSRLLGTEQPSYGILEPRDLQPSVEQWAAQCIAWMRSVQPRGPYYLAGFCLGGNLAFEMASQLAPTNEVAMVALIESRTPYATARGTLTTGEYARNFVRSVSGFGIRTLRQSRAEQITLMTHELRRASRFAAWKAGLSAADDMDLAAFEEQVDVRHYDEKQLAIARQHFDMLMTHDWRPYAGHVHLFRSHRHGFMPRLPALGWELLAGDVTVDVVSGAHEEMLTEPHVHALAERLSARLDELHAQKPVAEEASEGPEEEESSDASSERETVTA